MSYTAAGTDTVNAAGVATVTVGPGQAHESWDVQRVSVLLSGSLVGEVFLYEGDPAPGGFVDASYVGARNSADYSPGTLVLRPGEFLTIQWESATPGALATARVRYGLL